MPKPLAAPGCARLTDLAGMLREIAIDPDHVPEYRLIIMQVNSGRISAPLVASNRREFRLADLPKIAATLGVELRPDLDLAA
jgi:hypothetical protein